MTLKLPKWMVWTTRAAQVRTQRSRISDRFEQDLREALKDLPYEIHSPLLLKNFVALTLRSGETQGTLGREARKQVDFAVISQRSRTPAATIVLTTREYGRDRRRQPAVVSDTEVQSNSIVPVLYLNPRSIKGAPAIARTLQPYL